jgi:K+-transporting ATPase KdpF subunit
VTVGAESLVGGLIALLILVYLMYSLLNPERF